MSTEEILKCLEEFRIAYNEIDIPTLEDILARDVHWEHRNKFKGSGRDGLIQSIIEFGEKTPGRYFDRPIRFALKGQAIFIEQKWHATPARSDPAWGWEKGAPISMDTCSIFVFEGAKITE
jgi:hypothetical protein